MNPEERHLLERTAKLAEDNNRMLRRIESYLRWGRLWGFIKIILILVPFVIGYFYLEPYLGSLGTTFSQAQDLLNRF